MRLEDKTVAQLKGEFTDKYVEAYLTLPQYQRFKGMVGRVVTVNENRHALVDFGDGPWYDIPLNELNIVPKPEPKADAKAGHK